MADYEYITATGIIVPDTGVQLDRVQAEFREVFGDDLDVSPETPQGQLITMEADARDSVVRLMAGVANQINPNLAGGVFLDAIWALTGGERVKATRSVAEGVVLTGVPGTIIPAGARARVASTQALFELTGAVVLDGSGSGVGTFQSVDFGPVDAPTGGLSQVVATVLGWEGVDNPTPAALGRLRENDAAARQRRRDTLALQSTGLILSIVSGLNATEGVRSCAVRENVEDTSETIDGVLMAPHSVYACVDGGTDADIAATLLRRKSMGAGWNGDVTVNVVDAASGQTYAVSFDRPELIPIFVNVQIAAGAPLSDPQNDVRSAILAYADGDQPGERGLVVGQDVSSFELAGAVNRTFPQVFVRSLTIGTAPGSLSPAAVSIAIFERAQIIAGNITVEVVA